MPDQPDEVQKPPRRSTALPPFFAPRITRPNTPVQSGSVTPPRRSSPLFTPPSVPKQSRPITPRTAPAFPRSLELVEAHESVTPPALAPLAAEEPASAVLELRTLAPPITRSEEGAFAEPTLAEPASPPPAIDGAPSEPEEATAARDAGDDGLVIEQMEHQPISLHSTGQHIAVQDEGTLTSFDYEDAARRAREERREVGGFEIERTELTLEPKAGSSPLEVESFWSAEPMQEPERATDLAASLPAELPEAPQPPHSEGPQRLAAMSETAESVEDVGEQVGPAAANANAPMEYLADPFGIHEPPGLSAPVGELSPSSGASSTSSGEPFSVPAGELSPSVGEPVAAWVAETSAFEPMAPDPPAASERPDIAFGPPDAVDELVTSLSLDEPADDAEAALEEAFAAPAAPDRPPRWATPRAVDAIVAAPPVMPSPPAPPPAPEDELSDALGWPNGGITPNAAGGVEHDGAAVDVSGELSASVAGWRAMPAAPSGPGSGMPDAVAAALERIARRVRAGEVPLPGDVALAASDESALAVALAALLRGGPRG